MKHTYLRLTLRGLWAARSRILAIFAIIALGVGFLSGLLSTTPDMYTSVDAYYDRTNMMDLRLVSTFGFTDDDLSAVRALEGVRDVMPAYSADLLLTTPHTDTLVAKLHSIPARGDWINSADLLEGRMPQNSGECVVEFDDSLHKYGFAIGDTLTISNENKNAGDTLTPTTLTVVGRVRSACYFSIERERSTVGHGSADLIVYVRESDFAYDVYTDLLLRVVGAEELDSFSDDYHTLVEEVVEAIEAIRPAREQARYAEITAEARLELDDARAEYLSKRTDAEAELDAAEKELNDAKAKLDDALAELDRGRAEYADGKRELDDARAETERQLNDAEKSLAEGRQDYADKRAEAERQLADTAARLDEAEKELTASRKTLNESRQEYEAGKTALAKARAEYEAKMQEAEQTLADSRAKIEESRRTLADSRAELEANAPAVEEARALAAKVEPQLDSMKSAVAAYDTAMAEYTAQYAQLETAEKELAEKQAAFAAGELPDVTAEELAYTEQLLAGLRAQLQPVRAELEKQAPSIEEARAAISALPEAQAAIARYTDGLRQLESGEAAFLAAEQQLVQGEEQYLEQKKAAEAEFAANEQKLADAAAELEAGEAQLQAGEKELSDGRAAYLSALNEAKAGFDAAEAELSEGERKLVEGRAEAAAEFGDAEAKLAEAEAKLADGERAYADGKADYDEGFSEYQKAREEAEAQFAEAEEELSDAEEELTQLKTPTWYILDRNDNLSYASFDSNAAKVKAVAAVFPLFFFLVAALVSLTTMTRMVEEERSLIGTLKALGYSSSQIAARYLFYATLTGVLGSLFGLAVGIHLFPTVIWNAYDMMYELPPLKTLFIPSYALLSSLTMIGCTLLATYSACRRTLIERPAGLLQPRAPKAGKRILLEHITPVWKQLKFTHKVTARNLFRYQKRLWMTIIGVAGCTALLLTGFGLRDSISDIVEKQFGELFRYNLTVVMQDTDALDDELRETLDNSAVISYLPAAMQNCTVSADGEGKESASMLIPAEDDALERYITLRTRRGQKPIPFDAHSVVITEKLGEQLAVGVGDTITLTDDNHRTADFTVSGVTENYVTAYIYLGGEAYAEAFGESASPGVLLASTDTPDSAARDALATLLLRNDGVSAVSFNDSVREQFDDLLGNIDYIVIVLIICAGLLAFIVLYNLININVTERQREIATIKVLGFYDGEVAGYVFRETSILTLLGTLAGLVLGIFLHAYVVRTAEVDAVMFGRAIAPLSYILSAAMTLAFGWLVNLVMLRRLRNINMVESLKSAE